MNEEIKKSIDRNQSLDYLGRASGKRREGIFALLRISSSTGVAGEWRRHHEAGHHLPGRVGAQTDGCELVQLRFHLLERREKKMNESTK